MDGFIPFTTVYFSRGSFFKILEEQTELRALAIIVLPLNFFTSQGKVLIRSIVTELYVCHLEVRFDFILPVSEHTHLRRMATKSRRRDEIYKT